jgi:hypothetical protein
MNTCTACLPECGPGPSETGLKTHFQPLFHTFFHSTEKGGSGQGKPEFLQSGQALSLSCWTVIKYSKLKKNDKNQSIDN